VSPSQPTPPPVRARGVRIARVASWFAFGVLALGLIVVLMSVWLLRSDSGRDFALARVLAVLPADSLSWRSVEGSVSGPLVLHGLRYSRSGLLIEVERAELDLAPLALTGRTLHVEALRLENGRVRLPPGDDAPQPWPRRIELPSALPELQLPLALALDMVSLRAIRVEQGELPLIDVQRFEASGRFERGRLALERLELDSDRAIVRAHGALDTASRWDTGLQASVDVIGIGAEPLPVQLDAQGDWRDLTLTARAALPAPATLTLRIFGGLPDPQWQLGLDAPQIDPLRLGSDGETIALALRGEGDLGRATFDGEFSQGARTVRPAAGLEA
jgi:translocation and assembly module TamB